MYKEYFITTPLILNKVTFEYRDCQIVLRGKEARSYIEGPTAEAVNVAFDFQFALRDKAYIPGLRFWLRSTSERTSLPEDPRDIRSEDWVDWAFSTIPLDSIPPIPLSEAECKSIQKEIDNHVHESLEEKTGGIV